jgi:hypothetical protein
MPIALDSFRLVLIAIEYLHEENRVFRQQLGEQHLSFSEDQRRRLATKAKELGRKLLREFATILTPERLLRRHQRLIAQNTMAAGSVARAVPPHRGRDRAISGSDGRGK